MTNDELRALADAQPLAWRCEVRGDGTDPKLGAVGWRHYHTTTSEREAKAFVARCGDGIEGRAVPLYAHPAPAAPQAEPKREPTDWLSTDDAETQLAMALQTVGIHGDDKRLLDALNCRGIWLAWMPSGGSDAE